MDERGEAFLVVAGGRGVFSSQELDERPEPGVSFRFGGPGGRGLGRGGLRAPREEVGVVGEAPGQVQVAADVQERAAGVHVGGAVGAARNEPALPPFFAEERAVATDDHLAAGQDVPVVLDGHRAGRAAAVPKVVPHPPKPPPVLFFLFLGPLFEAQQRRVQGLARNRGGRRLLGRGVVAVLERVAEVGRGDGGGVFAAGGDRGAGGRDPRQDSDRPAVLPDPGLQHFFDQVSHRRDPDIELFGGGFQRPGGGHFEDFGGDAQVVEDPHGFPSRDHDSPEVGDGRVDVGLDVGRGALEAEVGVQDPVQGGPQQREAGVRPQEGRRARRGHQVLASVRAPRSRRDHPGEPGRHEHVVGGQPDGVEVVDDQPPPLPPVEGRREGRGQGALPPFGGGLPGGPEAGRDLARLEEHEVVGGALREALVELPQGAHVLDGAGRQSGGETADGVFPLRDHRRGRHHESGGVGAAEVEGQRGESPSARSPESVPALGLAPRRPRRDGQAVGAEPGAVRRVPLFSAGFRDGAPVHGHEVLRPRPRPRQGGGAGQSRAEDRLAERELGGDPPPFGGQPPAAFQRDPPLGFEVQHRLEEGGLRGPQAAREPGRVGRPGFGFRQGDTDVGGARPRSPGARPPAVSAPGRRRGGAGLCGDDRGHRVYSAPRRRSNLGRAAAFPRQLCQTRCARRAAPPGP